MILNRELLLETLTKLQPGVDEKSSVPESQNITFTGELAFACNYEIAVTREFEFDYPCSVRSSELHKLLNKIKSKEVEVEVTDSEFLIKSKKAKAGIKLSATETKPFFDPPEEWNKLPKDFSTAINFCLFSVGKNLSESELTCVHVKNNFVESTDKRRITRYFMEDFIEGELFIPGFVILNLVAFDPVTYSTTESWLHFMGSDGTMFSCRVQVNNYPVCDDFFKNTGEQIKFPKDLEEIIEKATIFSVDDSGDATVTINFKHNTMTVRGEGNQGWFEETRNIKFTGNPLEIYINAKFLSEIVKHERKIVTDGRTISFTTDKFAHVAMLRRPTSISEENTSDE